MSASFSKCPQLVSSTSEARWAPTAVEAGVIGVKLSFKLRRCQLLNLDVFDVLESLGLNSEADSFCAAGKKEKTWMTINYLSESLRRDYITLIHTASGLH